MDLPIKEFTRIGMLCIIVMVRLGAVLGIVPFFSKQFISGTGRNAAVLALSMPLFIVVWPTMPKEELHFLFMGLVIVKEAVIGLILGFAASFIFYVAEGVGFVIDVQRGSSMATIFDPLAGSQTSLMGSFLVQMSSVLFFVTGGFLYFLDLVYRTYQIWPVFSYIPKLEWNFVLFFSDMINDVMIVMFCLAAPILIILFLCEFGLGMVNRFAPQLNVFFLSMPIKSWVSMLLLLTYFSILGHFFFEYFTSQNRLLQFVNIFVKR